MTFMFSRRWIAVFGLLGCGWLFAQSTRSEGDASPRKEAMRSAVETTGSPRFTVIPTSESSILLDVTNGNSWILTGSDAGTPGWSPLPHVGPRPATSPQKKGLQPGGAGKTPETMRVPLQNILGMGVYVRIPILKTETGYLSVRAKLDGRDVTFILDTGAPLSYLDRKRMDPFKLNWLKTRLDPLKNPPGAVSPDVVLSSLQLDSFRCGRVQFVEYDLSDLNERVALNGDKPFDGLIGADFFNQYLAIIDYSQYNIYLFDRGSK